MLFAFHYPAKKQDKVNNAKTIVIKFFFIQLF